MSPAKLVGLGGILGSGLLGMGLGSSIASSSMGDSSKYYYLLSNKRAIVSGSAPFDEVKTQ